MIPSDDSDMARRRRRRRRAIVLIAALGLGTALFAALLATGFGVDGLRSRIERATTAATGLDIQIGRLTVSLFPPRAVLEDIRIASDGRTVATAAAARADFRWRDLWRPGPLAIAALDVEGPEVRLDLDADWPRLAAAAETRAGTELRIEETRVRGGTLVLARPRDGLAVRIDHLDLSLTAAAADRPLAAVLEQARVDLAWRGTGISGVSVRGRFEERDGVWHWRGATLEAAGTGACASEGTLQPRRSAIVSTVRCDLESGMVARHLGLPEERRPRGQVRFTGTLRSDDDGPRVEGRLAAGSLTWFELPFTALSADVRAAPEQMALEALAAGVAGGRLEGRLAAAWGVEGWTLQGSGRLTDVDPEQLPIPAAVRGGLPPVATRADLDARLALALADPSHPTGDWTMRLRAVPGGRGTLPVAGELSGRIDAGVLHLAPSRIETAAAVVEASGTADLDGRVDLEVSLQAADLGPTATRLAGIWPVLETWRLNDSSGSLEFEGTIEGLLREPAVAGVALAEDLTLAGLPIGALRAHLATDGRQLFLDQVDVSGPLARLTFTGSGPQARPAELRGSWTAEWIDAGALAALSGRPEFAEGLVSGAGELEPGPAITARLSGSSLRVVGLEVDRLTAEGRADRSTLRLDSLRLERGDASATAAGSLPWRAADGAADGIALHVDRFPIDGLAGRTDVRGRLSLAARLGGSVAQPRPIDAAAWSLEGFGWRNAGPVDLAGEARLMGSELLVTAAGAEASWTGTARFDLAESDGLVAGELRITALDLDIAEAARAAGARARIAGALVQFEGPWRRSEALRLGVDIDRVTIAAPDWTIENRTPIHLFGEGGRLRLDEVPFAVSDQEVRVRGDLDLGEPLRLDLELAGAADLRTLAPLLPGVVLGGTASFDLRVEGPLDALRTIGEVDLRNGFLRHPAFPHPLQRVAGHAAIDGDRLRLTRLQADLGGGTVDAVGEATVHGLTVERFAFDIEGRGVALRMPEHLATLSDLHLRLEGTPSSSRLSGTVDLARARYTADLRLDRALFTPPTRPIEGFAPPGLLDRVQLDLLVFAPGQIWLDNDLGRAEFRADLEVGGTAAHPVLAGTIDAVRGGRLRFREVDYTLVGAHLTFTRDFPNDPEIEATAETRLHPYDVAVTVYGRASAPRLDLATTPELPREQVVSLLLSGGRWRPDEPAGPGERGQEFALQGQIGATSSVAENLGVDVVRLDPVLSAEQADPTARVTLGGWVSRRLFASYSFLLGDSAGDAVELRYRLLENFEVRAAREGDGTNVAEGRFLRSFDTTPHAVRVETGGNRLTEPVRLSGVPDPPGATALLRALDLPPGSSLERGRVLLATRRAEERLAVAGYPRARLDCRVGDSQMTCDVLTGPLVELEIDGVKGVKDRRAVRDEVWRAWQELVADEDLAPEAIDAARRVLHDRGYATVAAEAEVEELPGDAEAPRRLRVGLHVAPGERQRVQRVVLNGLAHLSEDQAREALLSARRDGLRRPLLTPNLLDDDTNTLLRLAFGAGCLEARVDPPVVTTPEQPDRAVVTFTVHEGPRYRLERVAFAGLSLLDEEALRHRLGLPPGSVIDPARLDAFARELRTDYDNLGFPDATVAWRLERGGEERAVAVFDVAEGPFARIGAIRIEGYRRTHEAIIRRELTLRPGDPLRRDDLALSRRRLGQLGIFRSIVLRPDPATAGQSVRDVIVRVDEKDNLDVSFGAGFDNEEGGRLSAALGLRNLGGTTASIGVQARWGELDRLAQLLTGWRHVRGSRYDTLGSLLVRTEERPSFTVHRRQIAAQLARPVVEGRSTIQYRYRIQDIRLSNLQVPEADTGFTNGILAGLGTSFARSTRDELLDPHTGGLRTADLEVNSSAIGSDSNFLRLILHEAQHFTVGPRRLVLGISGRAGAAWVFDDTLVVPLSERFFAGGVASVRGFEKDLLGPLDPISGKPTGGEALFVVNAEARLPLSERLTGIWFLDGGNVFPRPTDFDPFDLRFATGPGLAIGTPVGPLQFFFGWKLDPLAGEDEWEFHFTFGPTF